MSRRSSRAWTDQVSLAGIAGGFPRALEPLSGFAAQCLHIKLAGVAAGSAYIPQPAETVDVFLAQLALELPIAHRFADDLAGGGVFAGVHGRLERGGLLAGQRNA